MGKEELREIGERLLKAIEKREETEPVQLPIWKETRAAAPNELSRSSLFPAIHIKRDKYLEKTLIAAQGDIEIHYSGPQLDQGHYDAFLGILYLARGQDSGTTVYFTAYRLLRLIGRTTSGADYKWLLSVFDRLTSTSVTIVKEGRKIFWGSLLPKGKGDLETGQFCIELSPELARLFGRGLTYVEWQQRKKLLRRPLAQWLQMYYLSHAKPYPVKVETLRDMSGSQTAQLWKFRQSLKTALNQIQTVGVIRQWTIEKDTDLVKVER